MLFYKLALCILSALKNLMFWFPSQKIDQEFYQKPLKIFYSIMTIVFTCAAINSYIQVPNKNSMMVLTLAIGLMAFVLFLILFFWKRLRPAIRYLIIDFTLFLGSTTILIWSLSEEVFRTDLTKAVPLDLFYKAQIVNGFWAMIIIIHHNKVFFLASLLIRLYVVDSRAVVSPYILNSFFLIAILFCFSSFFRQYFEYKTLLRMDNLFLEQKDHLAINTILDEGMLIIGKNKQILFANPKCKEILEKSKEILNFTTNKGIGLQLFLEITENAKKPLQETSENEDEICIESIIDFQLQRLKQMKNNSLTKQEKFHVQKGRLKTDRDHVWVEIKSRLINQNADLAILLVISEVTDKVENIRLKEVDEYKDKLLAVVTHELRTPLNCIIPMISTAVDDICIPDNIRTKILRPCLASAKLLHNLVNDILDYYQIKNQKIRLNLIDFDLRAKLKETFQLFEVPTQLKGLSLQIEVADDVPIQIHSDPNRITQILNNLIGNSTKFTPSGGTIHLRASKLSNSNTIKIEVSDNGAGMSEDTIGKLFTDIIGKGTTNYSSRDIHTNPTGIGIGMSISNHLAILLGGKGINVESEIGRGSCFTFQIPLISSQNTLEPTLIFSGIFQDKEEIVEFIEIDFQCRCKNILIVDDNMYNILALKAQLALYGLNIYSAFDGQEAVDFIANVTEMIEGCGSESCQFIRLILMDYEMPRLNGLQATVQINSMLKHKESREIAIVLNTAHNDAETKAEAAKAGVYIILTKPTNPIHLKEVLNRYFS